MHYRADIDGLRAIAVLSVVMFHLGVPGFQGGFVGVDIFFVISGFLITSIIEDRARSHRFILRDFYLRRIRRLVPPLIATVAATCIAAGAVLTPHDTVGFGKSAVAALFSLSNVVFFLEAGYWDTASELKPLLHTWSLGVEEQFYLFWPTLVVGLVAIERRISLLWSLLIISVAGFGLCVWYTSVSPSAAFYLLPFRVFQFSLGALVLPLARSMTFRAVAQRSMVNEALVALGLALVCGSVLLFDADTRFPGTAVVWPTLGAMLLLAGCSHPRGSGHLGHYLLENPASVWLGQVSYSLYLVHWPMVALYRYRYGLQLAPREQLMLAVATLVTTVMLHYGIERRFYQRASATGAGRSPAGPRFAVTVLGIACSVASLPLIAWVGDGWGWRFPNLDLSVHQIEEGKRARYTLIRSACTILDYDRAAVCAERRPIQVLVFGNSHEPDGYNFLAAGYGADSRLNLIRFGSTNHCDNLRFEDGRANSTSPDCGRRLQRLFNPDFVADLDVVFYAANRPYASNKQVFYQILRRLKQINPALRLIVLGGYINTRVDCARLINETRSSDTCAQSDNVGHFY